MNGGGNVAGSGRLTVRIDIDINENETALADLVAAGIRDGKLGEMVKTALASMVGSSGSSGIAAILEDMHDKIVRTHALALLGRRLGIEQQSEVNMAAEFMLRRHISSVSKSTGISVDELKLKTEDVAYMTELTERLVEDAIASYSGVLACIPTGSVAVGSLAISAGTVGSDVMGEKIVDSAETVEDGEEDVNFEEEADLASLMQFIGM